MWSPIQSKKQGSKKNSGVEVGDEIGEWKKKKMKKGGVGLGVILFLTLLRAS